MKTLGRTLLFLVSLFFSCQVEDSIDQTGNYWDSNYLRKHQLRGAVNIIQSVDPYGSHYMVFDRKGNPVSGYSTPSRYLYTDTSTWSMVYAGGRLMRSTTCPSKRQPLLQTTTHYEYNNLGKYIPDPDELSHGQLSLIPGLSAQYTDTYRYDFTFYGSELWVVHSAVGMDNDTTIVQYSGNYPSSFVNRNFECTRIEYADNGMIKMFNVLTMEGYREMVYTFMPDKTYQLMDNLVTTTLPWDIQTNTLYNYNDHRDLLEVTSEGAFSVRFSNYVYDAKGNWIQREYAYAVNMTASSWAENLTYHRKIIYY